MRRQGWALLLLIGWLLPSPAAPLWGDTGLAQQWEQSRRANEAYERGKAALLGGRRAEAVAAFDEAAARYQQVLKDNPRLTELYAPLGDMLVRRGQATAAYFLLSKQVRAAEAPAEVRWQLARALRGMKQTRRALQLARQVEPDLKGDRAGAPTAREIGAFIGECAAEVGEAEVAVARLLPLLPAAAEGRVPAEQEAAPGWRRLLGESFSRLGRRAEALAFLEPLYKERPQDPLSRRALGMALLREGGPAGAGEQALRGVALLEGLAADRPDDLPLVLALGQGLLGQGRAATALPYLRRYADARPGDRHGQVLLARALSAQGRPAEAVALLQRLPPADAGDPEVQAELGHLLLAGPAPGAQAAEQALGRALARAAALSADDRSRACSDHATALFRLGRLPSALAEANRCAGLTPGDPDPAVLLVLGKLQHHSGKTGDAIGTYRLALRQRPAAPLARALMGDLALLLLGRNQGIADLLEAHRLWPAAPSTRALALHHLAAGRPEEALTLLRPFGEAREADAPTLGAYARALRETGHGAEALAALRRAQEAPNLGEPPELPAALRLEEALALLALRRPQEACLVMERERVAPSATPQLPEEPQLLRLSCIQAARAELESGPGKEPQGPKAALGYLQSAARSRAPISDAERTEVQLLEIIAELRGGEAEPALRRLQALAREPGFDAVRSLLGPGGHDALLARAQAASYVSRAAAAFERGDYERAQLLLKSQVVQAELGQRPEVLYDLGAVLLARGKREESLALWNRIDARDVPEKWIALGAYHDAAGDRQAALEHYRRYLQHTSSGPRAERVRHFVEVLERFDGAGPQSRAPAAPGPVGTPPAAPAPAPAAESGRAARRLPRSKW